MFETQKSGNKTNHPISSNSHHSATANKAKHSLKKRGGLQNQQGHHIISGEFRLNIRRLASPKVGQDQVSKDVFNLLAIRGPTRGEGMPGIEPGFPDPQSNLLPYVTTVGYVDCE